MANKYSNQCDFCFSEKIKRRFRNYQKKACERVDRSVYEEVMDKINKRKKEDRFCRKITQVRFTKTYLNNLSLLNRDD